MKILIDEATVKQAIDLLDRQWKCSALWSLEESQNVSEHLSQAIEQAEKPEHAQKLEELGWSSEAINKANTPQQKQEPVAWIDGATHYQPQQKAFYKRVSATEWYVWSRIDREPLHWMPSPGTGDSANWILRKSEQAQQEPVAWMTIDSNGEEDDIWYENPEGKLLEGWTYIPLYTSPPQRQPLTEWQPIDTAPKTGKKVILFYLNRNKLARTVMARWLTDEQAAEEDYDDVGLEGGWYECIDNWDDYTQVAIHEGEPTHWMPLPPPPNEAAHGIGEQK